MPNLTLDANKIVYILGRDSRLDVGLKIAEEFRSNLAWLSHKLYLSLGFDYDHYSPISFTISSNTSV